MLPPNSSASNAWKFWYMKKKTFPHFRTSWQNGFGCLEFRLGHHPQTVNISHSLTWWILRERQCSKSLTVHSGHACGGENFVKNCEFLFVWFFLYRLLVFSRWMSDSTAWSNSRQHLIWCGRVYTLPSIIHQKLFPFFICTQPQSFTVCAWFWFAARKTCHHRKLWAVFFAEDFSFGEFGRFFAWHWAGREIYTFNNHSQPNESSVSNMAEETCNKWVASEVGKNEKLQLMIFILFKKNMIW